MKKFILYFLCSCLFCAVTIPVYAQGNDNETVQITVEMWDSYGIYNDEVWEGDASLSIIVNGVYLKENAKMIANENIKKGDLGYGPAYFTFNAEPGEVIEFFWNRGSWDSECAFAVYYSKSPPDTEFDPRNWENDGTVLLYRLYNTLSNLEDGEYLGSYIVYGPFINGNIKVTTWREGNEISLTEPVVFNAEKQGWQISEYGQGDWKDFDAKIASMDFNGKYLRYYAANNYGTVYSNVVIMRVLSKDEVEITIEMQGYDWRNGGALLINVNGKDLEEHATFYESFEKKGYYYFSVEPSDEVMFFWMKGAYWDGECAFAAYYSDKPPSPEFDPDPDNGWKNDGTVLLYRKFWTLSDVADGEILGSFIVYAPIIEGSIKATTWRDGKEISLTEPLFFHAEKQGWLISEYGQGEWKDFDAKIASVDFNGKYLRFYAENKYGTVYSNIIKMRVLSKDEIEITIEMWGGSWRYGNALIINVNGEDLEELATLYDYDEKGYYTFIIQQDDEVKYYMSGYNQEGDCAFAIYYSDEPPIPEFDPDPTNRWIDEEGKVILYRLYGQLINDEDDTLLEPFRYWTDVDARASAFGNINTSAKTIAIATEPEFGLFAYNLFKNPDCYEGYTVSLASDLDLSERFWRSAGMTNVTFDGDGHTITGMKVYDFYYVGDSPIYDYEMGMRGYGSGLFGKIDRCIIRNLTMENPIIDVKSNGWDNNFIGTIAGLASGAQIRNVVINNPSISTYYYSSATCVGGVVGYAMSADVKNSVGLYMNIINGVDVYSGKISGTGEFLYVGGIAGANYDSFIGSSAVYDTEIESKGGGTIQMGGIAGYTSAVDHAKGGYCLLNNLSMVTLHATGEYYGEVEINIGGICGWVNQDAAINNLYIGFSNYGEFGQISESDYIIRHNYKYSTVSQANDNYIVNILNDITPEKGGLWVAASVLFADTQEGNEDVYGFVEVEDALTKFRVWTTETDFGIGLGDWYVPFTGDCEPRTDDNITWAICEGTLTISGEGDMPDYEYSSPWANYRPVITSVVVEDGITGIGEYAFFDCQKMKSVVIGKSVVSIGDGAFGNCTRLTEIYNYAANPQQIDCYVFFCFDGIDQNEVTLYVPACSEEIYRETEVWNELGMELIGNCEIVELEYSLEIIDDEIYIVVDMNENIPQGGRVEWAQEYDLQDGNLFLFKFSDLESNNDGVCSLICFVYHADGIVEARYTVNIQTGRIRIVTDPTLTDAKVSLYLKMRGDDIDLLATIPYTDRMYISDVLPNGEYILSVEAQGYLFTYYNKEGDVIVNWTDPNITWITFDDGIDVITVKLKEEIKLTGTITISGKVVEASLMKASIRPTEKSTVVLSSGSAAKSTDDIVWTVIATTIPDDDGNYSFTGLPPGLYRITVEIAGYDSEEIVVDATDLGGDTDEEIIDQNFVVDEGTKTVSVVVYAVTNVSLNKTTLTLFIDDEERLIPTVEPNNATNKEVTWSSSNYTLVNVDNDGLVTAKNIGTATITVQTIDGKHTATCAVTVQKKEVTGFEISDAIPVQVYPNPTDGIVALEFDVVNVYRITVADMNGKIMLRQLASDRIIQMDISNFPVGVYLLIIDDGKWQKVIRLVKN